MLGKQETQIGRKTRDVRNIQRQGSQLESNSKSQCAEDAGGTLGNVYATGVHVNSREKKGVQAVKECLKGCPFQD